ncbi:hypothetical protein OV079_02210 [Nannocystis pusilla]|uniref:Uncharacterized protein n=1 Tax=Nannocystis pusilla TaxID=889268 RepID=A0A9X3EHX8_9BACT|nr:hypothetical protein [Nannocystis pusilla]MCY1004399.1 hypothetical protein [Nannocystis pusilla]
MIHAELCHVRGFGGALTTIAVRPISTTATTCAGSTGRSPSTANTRSTSTR